MKTKKKIKKRHRVNTYNQACNNLLTAMKEVSDGQVIWQMRQRYLLLKAEIDVIQNNIEMAEEDFFGKGD